MDGGGKETGNKARTFSCGKAVRERDLLTAPPTPSCKDKVVDGSPGAGGSVREGGLGLSCAGVPRKTKNVACMVQGGFSRQK